MHTRDFLLGFQGDAKAPRGGGNFRIEHSSKWLNSYIRDILISVQELMTGFERAQVQRQQCLALVSNFMVHVMPFDRTCYCLGLGAGAIVGAASSNHNKDIVFDLGVVENVQVGPLFSALSKDPSNALFIRHNFSKLPVNSQIKSAPHAHLGGLVFGDIDRHRQEVLSCFATFSDLWSAGVEICLCGSAASMASIVAPNVAGIARFKNVAQCEFTFGGETPCCFAILS